MNGSSVILNNIRVTLQGNELLKNVSFALLSNEHLAIVGSSGSGKTTLAKVIAGQLFASGSMRIHWNEESSFHKKVILTEQRNQFKNLSNTTDFYYQQRYNSFDNADAQTVIDALLAATPEQNKDQLEKLLFQFGLYGRKEAPLIQLSSGENKRFQLIKAILSGPQILILDSPFTGLDIAARKHLHNTINELANGEIKIIIITDGHQIPECITHVALLDEGILKSFVTKNNFNPADIPTHSYYHDTHLYSLPVSQNTEQYDCVVDMRDVNIAYGDKTVLNHINWQIRGGEKWLLRGANGAGKSTLISLINGDNPQAYKNEIYLFDKRRGTGESIWDIKKKTGFVSPELHAFFDKGTSCYNAIASGFFDTIGLFRKLSEEQHQQVQQWIDFLHLKAVQNKPMMSLSFGAQRLVLLARAMVKNPTLLILDEPCQGLDDEQKNVFINLVNELCEQFGKTLIYISHYNNEVPSCIDHVLELKNGVQEIYSIKRKEEFIN